ncbi:MULTISPECIES: DUF5317 domain-containing protein [unclassified Meiothermus]|uniref:DUF5317 domain-containing protein n=1 Tax=unclassified Meiothermus TaxID=370471 RepID=UPI000D7C51C7|nr:MULTISPECIES: DUF5317 domain-containing protein [unclassified Meiothermus]PZA08901.1 hypothetical protein DNA98_02390 [Meiothermus sp. Pnk-1]RYM33216.1 hypothetical protein EWH23_13290 [Meiothermus sp. PNK-Is4]
MLAAGLEGGLAFATVRGLLSPELAGPIAKVSVLAFVGYGLLRNLHLKSLWFVWLGLLANTLVILANGGHMPVSAAALRQAGLGHLEPALRNAYDAVHVLMHEQTRLWFLGDVIPVQFKILRNVMSLGDVLLMLGIAGVILEGALQASGRDPFNPPKPTKLRLALGLYLAAVVIWAWLGRA